MKLKMETKIFLFQDIVNATFIKGECFDCGSKLGYFRSILKTAIKKPGYKKEILKVLKDL